ncbi:MAG: hypothetical protein PHE53_00695 [Thermoguttaceae bacterium]|nr:hypothetical protein [Thermoguttaceae bacterium]
MSAVPRRTRLFISAGEPSGDHHGAMLIRELRQLEPTVEIQGFGGPLMRAAGMMQQTDLTQLAVFGFVRVLQNIRTFSRLLESARRIFANPQTRPDAVIVIDYPGFHWELAKRAKRYGIQVYYFVPPQIWAWAQWRVRKMRRLVDHAFCSLPFEEPWLRQHGCNADYVGHPFFDAWQERSLDTVFLNTLQSSIPLITILPGSRNQEVLHNFPCFLRSAWRVYQTVPQVRFAVAAFRESQAMEIRRQIEEFQQGANSQQVANNQQIEKNTSVAERKSIEALQKIAEFEKSRNLDHDSQTVSDRDDTENGKNKKKLPIHVYVNRTPELIASATACMACSGSVSLELLANHCPTVIHYRVSRLAMRVQRYVRKTRYITLVNLLASEHLESRDLSPYDPNAPQDAGVLFPEYLVCDDASARIAEHLVTWLTQPEAREAMVKKLAELHARVGTLGAAHRTALAILSDTFY